MKATVAEHERDWSMVLNDFCHAIEQAGLTTPAVIIADGKIHRFASNGDSNDDAGWYVLHDDNPPMGAFGCWRTGIRKTWCPRNTEGMTAAQRQAHDKRLMQLQRQRDAEEAHRHMEVATTAQQLWQDTSPALPDHPYLKNRGVAAYTLRIYRGPLVIAGLSVEGALVVPLHDAAGKLWSLEFILEDGTKRFLPGGKKRGCFCLLGKVEGTICIVEGYATGASVYEATDLPVVVAFDAGNLRPVAEVIRAKYPTLRIIICGDHDASGTGQTKAKEAAEAVNGSVALPEKEGEDWNDVHVQHGLPTVRAKIHAVLLPSVIPLDDIVPQPMSIEAFPDVFGQMVEAVAKSTETPVELAAMMGLGTVAAACQKKFVVMPEPGYQEPLCLWVVAALESGNRKTAVHLKMTEPLRVRERKLCEDGCAERTRIESARKTAEARIKGLRTRVGNSEDSEEIERLTKEIEDLEADMPEIPVVPRLWAQDVTTEKLGMVMADNGERLALLSDEGGVFDILAGRYSNGLPNLDLFLQSHAGAPVRVDRGARPSVMMQAPALTLALSPQPSVLRGLSEQSRFRDRGLLARILYALPPSKLGYRTLSTQAVPDHVAEAYHQAINALLDHTPPSNDHGDEVPHIIRFSAEAYEEWKAFQRTVECGMRPGEQFEHVKDWAGKLPGAAARVAGLFHCLIHSHRQPWAEPIHLDTMKQALVVLAILSEHARAVFALMGADPALEGGRRVWRWIERKRKRKFTGRECYQELRGTFHKMANLAPALDLLVERGYLIQEGHDRPGPGRKSQRYIVNAVLTEGWA